MLLYIVLYFLRNSFFRWNIFIDPHLSVCDPWLLPEKPCSSLGFICPPIKQELSPIYITFYQGRCLSQYPQGALCLMEGPILPPLNLSTTRPVFSALHNIFQYLLHHTHVWYNFLFKISFTFYLSIYTYIYYFFLGFQILIYIWKTIVSVSCCANNWTLNLNMLIM